MKEESDLPKKSAFAQFNDIVLLGTVAFTGIALILNPSILYPFLRASTTGLNEISPSDEMMVRLVGLVLLLSLGAYTAFRYLRPGGDPKGRAVLSEGVLREMQLADQIKSELKNQQNLIRTIAKSRDLAATPFSDEQRSELFDLMQDQIRQNLSEDFIRSIENTYGRIVLDSERRKVITREYDRIRARLLEETLASSRRGNLNLVIGIAVSMVGIIFLGWSVVEAPDLEGSQRDLLSYYIPRTTFVLLIEVFAFFFLNLYRVALGEIKYFQNELTNVELKILALEMMLTSEDRGELAQLANEFASTERNFVLRRGQTTAELEAEMLRANLHSIWSALRHGDQKG